MPKSPSPQGSKPNLPPLHSFVLYCLSTPKDRRDAVRELLGDAEASHLFADTPHRNGRNVSATASRGRGS